MSLKKSKAWCSSLSFVRLDSLGCGSEVSEHTQGPFKCKVKLTSSQAARARVANVGAIDSESRQSQGLVYTAEQYEYGVQRLQPHCLAQLFLPPTNLEILRRHFTSERLCIPLLWEHWVFAEGRAIIRLTHKSLCVVVHGLPTHTIDASGSPPLVVPSCVFMLVELDTILCVLIKFTAALLENQVCIDCYEEV